MFKRISIFLLTNILILATISLSLSVLSVFFNFSNSGLYGHLLIATLVGFSGAFISLLLSKKIAIWSTGARIIKKETANSHEAWLLNIVETQSKKLSINKPELAIYSSSEVNAFATGRSKNSGLVALSSGLLQGLNNDEVEAVIAHEVSHIANGDMVTMTLVQGLINTFVVFISRILGELVDKLIFKNEEGQGIGFFVSSLVFQIMFGFLASILVMHFSRRREYKADLGAASLVGKNKMISALNKIDYLYNNKKHNSLPKNLQAFGINGTKMVELFSTHPTIKKRVDNIQKSNLF